jgi:3'(2'), 5'-bisphosphate nucleotidase
MLKAARIAMKHYGNLESVQYKADNSPLTDADLEIDQLIYDELSREFADIALITEERSQTHQNLTKDAPFFLVDPIDGTKEFINKRDEFTVNIGLIENSEPVLGAICIPAKSILYIGAKGQGAFEYPCDLANDTLGEPKKLAPRWPDNHALNIVASRSHLCENTRIFIDANRVGNLVSAGSSLKFCLLASGAADLYPRFGPTMEWDTAAGHAILAAAGGMVEDLDGNPLIYGKRGLTNGVFLAYTPGVEFKRP